MLFISGFDSNETFEENSFILLKYLGGGGVLHIALDHHLHDIQRRIQHKLRLYGVGHMVKDHSYNERRTPLLHGLLFSIISVGPFIYTIPHTG